MSRALIGLTGGAGAGKDTCAALLARHGFMAIAFADAVRAEISQAWGVPVTMFTDRATKEIALASLAIGMCHDTEFLQWAAARPLDFNIPRSPRWVLQTWGTDYRRDNDPEYWVRIVERWVRRQWGISARRLVITDVRFVNEACLVTALGGHVVQVVRPELARLPPDTAGHASELERAAVKAAAEIHNDGDLQHLEAECLRVLCSLYREEFYS